MITSRLYAQICINNTQYIIPMNILFFILGISKNVPSIMKIIIAIFYCDGNLHVTCSAKLFDKNWYFGSCTALIYIYIFYFFLDPVTNICTSIRILFFINNYFLACNYFLVRMFKYQISSHKCYWYFSPILGHNFSGTFYFHKIIRCSSNSSQTENNRNIISKGQMRSIPNCVL